MTEILSFIIILIILIRCDLFTMRDNTDFWSKVLNSRSIHTSNVLLKVIYISSCYRYFLDVTWINFGHIYIKLILCPFLSIEGHIYYVKDADIWMKHQISNIDELQTTFRSKMNSSAYPN